MHVVFIAIGKHVCGCIHTNHTKNLPVFKCVYTYI